MLGKAAFIDGIQQCINANQPLKYIAQFFFIHIYDTFVGSFSDPFLIWY